MKKYKLGYTQGVYDMFHIGHLNLINKAKEYCEQLVVGVNADKLVEEYKHKTPIIPESERSEIIKNLKAVDDCIVVSTLDKLKVHDTVPFDAIFIGDDWKNDERWKKTSIDLKKIGVDVVFLPYTSGISSTQLLAVKDKKVDD